MSRHSLETSNCSDLFDRKKTDLIANAGVGMKKVKLTGDTHGKFWRIDMFCYENPGSTKDNDLMIILGDAGINYHGDERDKEKKHQLAKLPMSFLCIHGNHEQRPESLPNYKLIEWSGGEVWVEDDFPSILFAKDGEIYDIEGKKTLVIGGAYSIDKYIRLQHGYPYFENEQPSDEVKAYVESKLDLCGWKVDVVLSHTAPLSFQPREKFVPNLDQKTVDKSTEEWLDKIEKKLDYTHWFCGHFHTIADKQKMHFLFENYVDFPSTREEIIIREDDNIN